MEEAIAASLQSISLNSPNDCGQGKENKDY